MSIDFQSFRKTLTYTSQTNNLNLIFQDLNEIGDLDRLAENRKKRYRTMMWSGLVGSVLSCIFLASLPSIAIGLVLVFAIFSITGFYFLRQQGRLDVPNYRYELIKKILELINRDREETSDINLQILLSPVNQANKKVSTTNHPQHNQLKKDLFKDQWLKLEGKFIDGTRFNLRATEAFQTVYGWKQGASGKMKYKTKSKSKGQLIQLSLKIPLRRYGAIEVLKTEAERAVKLPENLTQKRLTFTDKSMTLSVKTPADYQNTEDLYKTVSMMFLSLYQVLNLANILSKQ